MDKNAPAGTATYTPAKGERVMIGKGKVVWIIDEYLTLPSGAKVAALTREGSNGYTNTTVEPERLKPAPATKEVKP